MHTRNRAFTLIEVLLALALTGLIASLALAPVMYAVRQVADTETMWADETALRRTAAFMARDVAAGLRLAPVVVRTIGRQELGGREDNIMIVASSAPAKQNQSAGSVVYKTVQRGFMNESLIPGLYRWLLPGVLPEDVDPDKLDAKDAQFVAPYVTELKLAVFEPPEWVSDYSGKMPGGMQFTLSRGEERVEYVFSFPQ